MTNQFPTKIPTIFERDSEGFVIPEITYGCQWVIDGIGISTEKLSGANIRVTVDGETVIGIEESTGSRGYVSVDRSQSWIKESIASLRLSRWADGVYECVVVGPSIKGNPLGLSGHRAYRLDWQSLPYLLVRVVYGDVAASFELLRTQFRNLRSVYVPHSDVKAEGIVWHTLQGHMAQLNVSDFR